MSPWVRNLINIKGNKVRFRVTSDFKPKALAHTATHCTKLASYKLKSESNSSTREKWLSAPLTFQLGLNTAFEVMSKNPVFNCCA